MKKGVFQGILILLGIGLGLLSYGIELVLTNRFPDCNERAEVRIPSQVEINVNELDQVIVANPFTLDEVHVMVENGQITQVIMFGGDQKCIVYKDSIKNE